MVEEITKNSTWEFWKGITNWFRSIIDCLFFRKYLFFAWKQIFLAAWNPAVFVILSIVKKGIKCKATFLSIISIQNEIRCKVKLFDLTSLEDFKIYWKDQNSGFQKTIINNKKPLHTLSGWFDELTLLWPSKATILFTHPVVWEILLRKIWFSLMSAK